MSHFWSLMDDELGEGYARTFASGHVLRTLGDRTVIAALEAGLPPRQVWTAVCDDLGIPSERRLGADRPPVEVPPELAE